MREKEKIIEKVKKILELAGNNPSKAEAQAAALKAQKLMAEYGVSMQEVDAEEKASETIATKEVDVDAGNKWKLLLSRAIADNFRCKVFTYGSRRICFYGHDTDAAIAAETFKYLFDIGCKAANRYYYRAKKEIETSGYYFNGRGIKNSFLEGYVAGIREVLEKQTTALMIVTPKDVEEEFSEFSKDFRRSALTFRINGTSAGAAAKNAGIAEGRAAVNAKGIACA